MIAEFRVDHIVRRERPVSIFRFPLRRRQIVDAVHDEARLILTEHEVRVKILYPFLAIFVREENPPHPPRDERAGLADVVFPLNQFAARRHIRQRGDSVIVNSFLNAEPSCDHHRVLVLRRRFNFIDCLIGNRELFEPFPRVLLADFLLQLREQFFQLHLAQMAFEPPAHVRHIELCRQDALPDRRRHARYFFEYQRHFLRNRVNNRDVRAETERVDRARDPPRRRMRTGDLYHHIRAPALRIRAVAGEQVRIVHTQIVFRLLHRIQRVRDTFVREVRDVRV